MEETVIRRELPNYNLPFESKDLLASLVSQELLGFKMGIFASSLETFREKKKLSCKDNPFSIPHGGPFFLSVQEGTTIVFNFDNLTSSVALRKLECDLQDKRFLDCLYSQDTYVPSFLKAKTLVDSELYYNFSVNKKIENISIYKYPMNYRGKPIGYDSPNEVAVCFNLSEGLEFLLMSGIGKQQMSTGIAIIEWNSVRRECLDKLERFWVAV